MSKAEKRLNMNKKELSSVTFSVKHGAHVLYFEICKASERNASKLHSGHLKFAPRCILQRSVFSRKKTASGNR